MTVTLTIDSLKQPGGELFPDLFPGEDMDSLLVGWLAQAEVSAILPAKQNQAAAAWVYAAAYNYVALRLANAPSSIAIDGTVTKSYASDQRKLFQERANYYLEIYYSLNQATPIASTLTFFSTVKAR